MVNFVNFPVFQDSFGLLRLVTNYSDLWKTTVEGVQMMTCSLHGIALNIVCCTNHKIASVERHHVSTIKTAQVWVACYGTSLSGHFDQELKINKRAPALSILTKLRTSRATLLLTLHRLRHPSLSNYCGRSVFFTVLFRFFLEFIPFMPLSNDNFTFYSKPKVRNIVGGFLPPKKTKAVLVNDNSWTLSMILMSESEP